MNVVTLIGCLATDPELRTVGEGKQRTSFLLAVDRPTKGEADFLWVAAWERQAETCAQYLAKGSRVAIDGRLRTWAKEPGSRDLKVEVVANRVQFLTTPPQAEAPAAPAEAEIPFEAAAV